MPTITVRLETAVHRTFRVEQVAGMFDVPLEQRLAHELTAEVPGMDEEWTIGAIVGPSGSGKTTLARAAFGGAIWEHRAWPRDRAIIDCFGDVPVKQLTLVLAAVGLGSPPTWLKPYAVLSGGEKFRAELARAVIQRSGARGQVVVVDEFTSSLDRLVAKTTSAALSRLLRSFTPHSTIRTPHCLRFVAVTCHDDVLPWLAPDWVVELGGKSLADAAGLCGRLTWGRLKRAPLSFSVERVPQAMWARFAPHHYLAGRLAASATCYGALWEGVVERRVDAAVNRPVHGPMAFCAAVAALGWKKTKRITRLVVLPEFQGLGIGGRMLAAVAELEAAKGNRVTITASHPAVLAHCSNSPRWRLIGVKKNGSTRQRFAGREVGSSAGRAVASFEWVGGQ